MRRPAVRLLPKGDAVVRARHPWVFSGAIGSVAGDPAPGAEVDVLDSGGAFAGRGLFNPHSQIRVRVYTWRDEPLDEAFFAARIRAAIALRTDVLGLGDPQGACRLVFSEGDDLSGLTVDRYGRHLIVLLTGLGIAGRLESILDTLEETLRPESISLRTEKGVADEEGLVIDDRTLRGTPPDGPIEIVERDLRFAVDLGTGQKTGFYLDQRANRVRAAGYAAGRSVADVCSYSGGFGIAAALAGAAPVTAVDGSAPALDLVRLNAERNGVADRVGVVRSDAFAWLSQRAADGERFDMIVLDPPRFARSRRGIPSALKAYQSLNASAIDCLEPGGVLVTFSCSGRVSTADFEGAVTRAAAQSGRPLRIVERLVQAPDHPVSATCPEGAYLKGMIAVAGR